MTIGLDKIVEAVRQFKNTGKAGVIQSTQKGYERTSPRYQNAIENLKGIVKVEIVESVTRSRVSEEVKTKIQKAETKQEAQIIALKNGLSAQTGLKIFGAGH